MPQLKHAGSIAQSLSFLLQAARVDTLEVSKLTAFVQAMQKEGDQEEEGFEQQGAPAADVYKIHSGYGMRTLQDPLDKAESQLGTLRKREASSITTSRC